MITVSTYAKKWLVSHPKIRNALLQLYKPSPHLVGLDYGIFLAQKLAERVPSDIDCVIGIPRSGVIFASIIATKRGLPLATPDLFIRGEIWQTKARVKPEDMRKVLLVDDSVFSGEQLDATIELLKGFNPELEILPAMLITSAMSSEKIGLYGIKIGDLAYYDFEWNLAHATHNGWGPTATDLDGVICVEGRPDEPYIIPNFEIQAIVTSRPENERCSTERWLKEHNVRYGALIMLRGSKRLGDIAVNHKVGALKKLKPLWYWESDKREAMLISKRAKIPVLCFQDMKVYKG